MTDNGDGLEPATGDVGASAAPSVLIQHWAAAMAGSGNVPFSISEIRDLLSGFAARLAAAVRTEPFSAAEGNRVGAELVAANMAEPEALSATLRILGEHLLESTGIADDAVNRQRLNQLTAELSGGFMSAARERIYGDQEMIKTAVIRAREDSDRARQISEARFHTVFNTIPIGMAIGDLQDRIHRGNPALKALLGYDDHELRQHSVRRLVHPEDWPAVQEQLLALRAGRMDHFAEFPRLLDCHGDMIWSRITVSLVRDSEGAPSYTLAMVEDTSDVHLLQGRLRHLSVSDKLTGLANADMLRSQMDSVLATSRPGELVALSYWDLDGFRVLNDGLGRQLGDQMLQIVASKLRAHFEPLDGLVARLAGDGFAVLIPDSGEADRVAELVQQTLDSLAEPYYVDGGADGIAASASVGIVVEPAADAQADELIKSAETTLHRAKTGGKAQWMLAEAELVAEDHHTCRMGALLPGALENGEFIVRYEPMFRLADRTLTGVHAVIYWDSPEHGLMAPEKFMPLAEETGMVVPIGRWVLDELCRQAAEWRSVHGADTPLVSIRSAGRAVRDQHVIRDFNVGLKRYDLPADWLMLSVPATALMNSDALEALEVLSENGVRLGVEGVGAGGLSLARLGALPFEDVSMNPGLVHTVTSLAEGETSPFERGLTCLISIAHDLDCTVTVGGLADPDKVERLHKFGVDIGFGPALKPRCDAAGIDEILRETTSG